MQRGNMEFTNVYHCFILSMFLFTFCVADDSESDTNRTFTGETLLQMGRRFSQPLLRLIGKSLVNMECRHHQCDEWSEWSLCTRFVGQYGAKRRERQCAKGAGTMCVAQNKATAGTRVESESQICQDYCPSKYELSSNGICLYFYNTTKKAKASSVADCQRDGGHLMIINSPRKWAAFTFLMDKYKYTDWVRVDGHRKDSKSLWEYTISTGDSGYTNWVAGEPHNSSTSLCLVARGLATSAGMADASCSYNRHFICEVSPM